MRFGFSANGGVCAAIVDVDLLDGSVGPLIEELVRLSVPVIIHTGGGLPASLAERFAHVEVHQKPTPSDLLVSRVAGQLRH